MGGQGHDYTCAEGCRQRHELLQDASRLAKGGLRSAPCFSMAGRLSTAALPVVTPGPGTFECALSDQLLYLALPAS